jgi:hypothetical protein
MTNESGQMKKVVLVTLLPCSAGQSVRGVERERETTKCPLLPSYEMYVKYKKLILRGRCVLQQI